MHGAARCEAAFIRAHAVRYLVARTLSLMTLYHRSIPRLRWRAAAWNKRLPSRSRCCYQNVAIARGGAVLLLRSLSACRVSLVGDRWW